MTIDLAAIEAGIRRLLHENGKLAIDLRSLEDNDDLYGLGLSSLATVGLMLAIEAEFDIEIPDALLTRDNFRSIGALIRTVEETRKLIAA
jgi:acyl carrier protein